MTTICEVLASRAIEAPDQLAYGFLDQRGRHLTTLSYGELRRRTAALAAAVRARSGPGDRVAVVTEPGMAFVIAFYAALWAGRVAVPAAPGRGESAAMLARVLTDAEAVLVLADESGARAIAEAGFSDLGVLHVEPAWDGESADAGPSPASQIAYLQYTSGSTGAPKGVMVTHANLMANSEQIRLAFDHSSASVGVIWLPPYHDMGLVGGIVQPLHVGFPVYLMSPSEFLRSPFTWLEAISRYRATTSGGPNFAFDQCVQRIAPARRAELDLSCWKVAFCGAEPISITTLGRFAEEFAASRFQVEALTPCYGLAEATLIVSCATVAVAPRAHRLEHGPAEGYVSSGAAVPGVQIAIVDPDSLELVGEGQRGEILVSSPAVTAGYWRRPGDMPLTRLGEGTQTTFLRTGDIGFLCGGELHICGRLKAIAIVRGRNISLEDVEASALAAHPDLAGRRAAAFVCGGPGEESLVVLIEAPPTLRRAISDDIALAVRETVARAHGVQIADVRLTASGEIPRTRSGKVKREDCRRLYEARVANAVRTEALSI